MDFDALPASARHVLSQFNASQTHGSCTRGCTSKDRLHWWGARIGDAGCGMVADIVRRRSQSSSEAAHIKLSNLLLGQNDLGDACMHTLADLADHGHFQELRALGLSRNRISDAGCEVLAGALGRGGFPRLRDLYMSQQQAPGLGDRCASSLAQALEAARGPRALEKISAGDNQGLTVEGLILLLHAMRHDAGRSYRGAPLLRELSLRNISRLCDAMGTAQRARLFAALSGLATPRSGVWPGGARRVHVVLNAPACRAAAQAADWQDAHKRWSSSQDGQVRVSVS